MARRRQSRVIRLTAVWCSGRVRHGRKDLDSHQPVLKTAVALGKLPDSRFSNVQEGPSSGKTMMRASFQFATDPSRENSNRERGCTSSKELFHGEVVL